MILTSSSKSSKAFVALALGITAVFTAANIYAVSEQFWLLSLIPVALGVLSFALLKPEQFWLFMVFLTPLSVISEVGPLQSSMALPTEPFIAFFMILLIFKFLLAKEIDYEILKHPITIIISIQLVWMLISSLTSTLPIVSLKYFISRFWFVLVFYFFGMQVFKKTERIDRFFWLIVLSMSAVIIFTLYQHSAQHFSHEGSYKAAKPFFKDHNIYAVIVAFLVPPALIYALKGRTLKIGILKGMMFHVLFAILLIGVIASYTRAAWVSLAFAFGFYILMLLKVRLRSMLTILLMSVTVLALSWNELVIYMSKNKVESDSDFDAHVRSIYNVTTDDSNTERLNRWNAAFRMFYEKPVFGFGPNTYQFKYAPFQISRQKTLISTNLGDLGNAHSEFIGPLAEMGLIGALLVIALMLVSIRTSMHIFYAPADNRLKYLALMVLMSLLTYYSHGLLNNYLDTDKANVCFWASMAIITIIDLQNRKAKLALSDTQ